MKQALRKIATHLDPRANIYTYAWHQLRRHDILSIRAWLADTYAPASVNKMLCAIRGVIEEAWRLGQVPATDYLEIETIAGINGVSLPPGRALERRELIVLKHACWRDSSAAGARDNAVIALLYACGLRRSEVVGLDLADYDAETSMLWVRRPKGRKDRSIPLARNGASVALRDWLARRGNDPGPLFLPVNKAGHVIHRRLTAQAIYNLLRKRARETGVAHFSPHDLRRTFVSHELEAGVDHGMIARVTGHSSLDGVARYDRRGDGETRDAVDRLDY